MQNENANNNISSNNNNNNNNNNRLNNNKTITSKSSEYKTKRKGSTINDNNALGAEVGVPLKYLSNFRRFLDFSLIN